MRNAVCFFRHYAGDKPGLLDGGILPGIFVYRISDKDVLVGVIVSFFALSALIRLAYFNVLEEERQNGSEGSRKSYLGVPVTTISVLLPLVYLLYDHKIWKDVRCFSVLLVFMGIGYLLPVKIKKPGMKGKIGLLLLGVGEAVGMLFFMGWGAV